MEVSCSRMGLTISSHKTKILATRPDGRPKKTRRDGLLRPSDEPVSVVESFKYLGSTISEDFSLDKGLALASVRLLVASRACAEYSGIRNELRPRTR